MEHARRLAGCGGETRRDDAAKMKGESAQHRAELGSRPAALACGSTHARACRELKVANQG